MGYFLILIFLLSYRQLYFVTGSRIYDVWLFVQITLIFILSVFYNSYHIFLGFFPGNFISWYKDWKRVALGIAYLAFSIICPVFIRYDAFQDDLLFLVPFIIIMLISPLGFRSMNSKMELQRQLKEANEQINELIKREERLRIARDLHDTLGHTLSLITLKSQLVEKLIQKDSERARLEVREIEKTSRAALSQVRELISDMRMISVREVLNEVQSILSAANISYHFIGDTHLQHVSLLTQNILSMCIKESVTNIVKHSHATKCSIQMEQLIGEVKIIVSDNGKGFSNPFVMGNGLLGMEERLQMIDGTWSIGNNNGTSVTISIPVILQEGKIVYDNQNCNSRGSKNASRSTFFSS